MQTDPDRPKNSELHYLPAKIDAAFPASTDSYFKPRETGCSSEGSNLHEASFRGRRLSGVAVELPTGVHAHLVSKQSIAKLNGRSDSVSSLTSEQERWTIKETYPRFFAWNHDTAPTKSDPILRCMEWLELSKHVHTTVTSEEIERMLQSDILQS